MKILMVVPEPFFTPRGTPLSVYGRLRALTELGHTVDVLTYHLGEDVAIPNVRILRAGLPNLVRSVGIGPSPAKAPLDLVLLARASALLQRGRYDCIHTHEEAALIGALLRGRYGIRHVYDMHSSLPEQFVNYRFPCGAIISRAIRPVERWVILRSDAIIAICNRLGALVKTIDPRARVFVVENTVPGPGAAAATDVALPDAGADLVALYAGNFEPNQGTDLLLDAMTKVLEKENRIRFWIVGGLPGQIDAARGRIVGRRHADRIVFFGKRPYHEMAAFLARADILLSPRSEGSNVPLKIYSYLQSGRPVAAIDRIVHTQVLDDRVAVLTEPTPEDFAQGILVLARDKELRTRLGRNARELVESKFTWASYVSRIREAYAALAPRPACAPVTPVSSCVSPCGEDRRSP